jgi:hypothetical protein
MGVLSSALTEASVCAGAWCALRLLLRPRARLRYFRWSKRLRYADEAAQTAEHRDCVTVLLEGCHAADKHNRLKIVADHLTHGKEAFDA